MRIPLKGWLIILSVVLIGGAALLAPKYIKTAIENQKAAKAAQDKALSENHWIYDKEGRRYLLAGGKSIKDKWYTVDTVNYHFNDEGYVDTGWIQENGKTYYLLPTGLPVTGWVSIDGFWYYFNPDNTMAKGWLEDNGARYYLNEDGKMATGWLEVSGTRYYLNEDGKMATGWTENNGNTYFLKEDGTAATGWFEYEGKKYYLRDDGAVTIGWVTEGDNRYFMKSDGTMAAKEWVESNKSRYYVKEDGKPATGWLELDSHWYYFHKDGSAAIGWLQVDGSWYYFSKDATMATGWIVDSTGESFYLKNNGVWDPNASVIKGLKPTVSAPARTGPMIALTFDDGPGPYTERILNVLQTNGAKATFFMLGQNIPKYTAALRHMADIGCELANHSYDHPKLTDLDISGVTNQIFSTNQALVNVIGYSAALVRPPYGAMNETVYQAAASPLVLWSIDTLDWKTLDPQSTIDKVLNNIKEGDIVLMHDIHEPTAAAVDTLIPKLKELGFQMVTVSELAAARGVSLENGKSYGSFH